MEDNPPPKKSFWSRYGNPPKHLSTKQRLMLIALAGLFTAVWVVWILSKP